jgi:GntR family transcriptional regulator
MLRELGYQPETTVLSVRECRAAEYEAAALALGCEPDAQLVIMERLRSQNADPLVYSIETVPREFLPPDLTPDALGGSLNELLASQQRRPRMSSASVSAVKLPKQAAAHFASTTLPWLLITETCLTDEGVPAVYARDYHRGDIFSFNFSRR